MGQRRLQRWLLVLALSLSFSGNPAAWAQGYPSKPVKIVVPFAAGSLSDTLARYLAEEFTKALGVQFIVEDKPGASAIIGSELVAKSPPDGYTLMLTSNTPHAANPHLFKKLPYAGVKDFTAIARVGFYPFVLLVSSTLPINSVPEFVAYAKANPGKLSYATSNSTSLVAAETIKVMAKIDLVGVPYKSNPQALTDLMSGQVHVMVADLGTSRVHVKAGKLRMLGVTRSRRTRLMPELPTISENGIPNFELGSWVGLVGPANMPKDIVDKLHGTLIKFLGRKDVQERIAAIGCELSPASPEEFRDFMEKQLIEWGDKIKAAGIEPE
jgi:tripartite-type tricarboxylate transporter receptor subunit TctC